MKTKVRKLICFQNVALNIQIFWKCQQCALLLCKYRKFEHGLIQNNTENSFKSDKLNRENILEITEIE